MDDFGVSFSPLSASGSNPAQTHGGPGGNSPIQDAIQILSLKQPRVVGAGSIAPSALLNAQGSMGQPDAIMALLRQIFGQAGMPGGGPTASGGSPYQQFFGNEGQTSMPAPAMGPTAPLPKITPGTGAGPTGPDTGGYGGQAPMAPPKPAMPEPNQNRRV